MPVNLSAKELYQRLRQEGGSVNKLLFSMSRNVAEHETLLFEILEIVERDKKVDEEWEALRKLRERVAVTLVEEEVLSLARSEETGHLDAAKFVLQKRLPRKYGIHLKDEDPKADPMDDHLLEMRGAR